MNDRGAKPTFVPNKPLYGGKMHWISQLTYRDPSTHSYLGSPTIVEINEDTLLAAHDYYGPGAPSNSDGVWNLTTIYRSTDRGLRWTEVTHISGAFWSSLFEHDGDLYLLGTDAEYGNIVIRRSSDGGATWTKPTDPSNGRLFEDGPEHEPPNYHCAPTPVVAHDGRLYRAFEDQDPASWPEGFRTSVISCEIGRDLLHADNWVMSEQLSIDKSIIPTGWGIAGDNAHVDYMDDLCGGVGWLEGNVVPAPDDGLVIVLRVNSKPITDRAAIIRIEDATGSQLRFEEFIDFPGGMNKFVIRRDPNSGYYLALVNENTVPSTPDQRTILSLAASTDLRNWEIVRTVTRDRTPISEESLANIGFQYPAWIFSGSDILYLSRTSSGGANNFHDANRITFDVISDFEELLPA